MSPLRRGDIWTAAGGGGYAKKPRPAIIIRDDNFDNPEAVTLIPLTSTPVDSPTRVPIPADATSGIDHPSYAMTDKIQTYRRSTVHEFCGRVTDAQLVEIERAMLLYLGVGPA